MRVTGEELSMRLGLESSLTTLLLARMSVSILGFF